MSDCNTNEITKAYDPSGVEATWYKRWMHAGCFIANSHSPKPAYSITIPPPNVTGMLTMGHVLNNSLQDILARRARMTGHEVLWLPGTDHAGIATQTVVEKRLRKEENLTRHDLGREAFLQRVWNWKEKHGGIIIHQLKRLGCSCDWSRERFTMDDLYSKAVLQTFVDLYHKGYIYRGKRMVNWCPVSLTALSDEEVIPKPQKNYLYHFKVEVVEEPGTMLEIATTRPETIMGDTAVAVNPRDPRYAHLVGKHVRRPLPVENQAVLPIIGDDYIDMAFGTGVLKVTPAHDKADYEIGLRHNLPVIDIMNPDGTLNALAGEDFAGLDRFEARAEAIERLRELGLLVKEEPHENNVGYSERADVPIEPRLSEQWFLRYPKTTEARAAVRNHLIRFFPERWEKVYDHWLENIQDWCISRQLWWGHRIPVWYRGDQTLCQIESPGDDWTQDPDVLDTWFSSWLWPFATMDPTTRSKFYPTSTLVTGPDIIFFWVARMIMAGLEYTGEVPFRDVYFTGIIRDAKGRKMSKSLGNSPDPLDLIEKYGADGLRFGLLRIAPQGQDIKFDEKQVEEGRNFCNKLWNAARFRQMQGPPCNGQPSLHSHPLDAAQTDIIAKLDQLIRQLDAAYDRYRFNEAAQLLYDFFWSEYCDWFVESAKGSLTSDDATARDATLAVMDTVLSNVLRLLHPFMPHITEELWSRLGYRDPSPDNPHNFIMLAPWPKPGLLDHLPADQVAAATSATAALHEAVRSIRNLRAEYNIASNKKVAIILKPAAETTIPDTTTHKSLASLAYADTITISPNFQKKPGTPSVLTPLGEFIMPLEGLLDLEAERARIIKEISRYQSELDKNERKLANQNFVANAPTEVVAEHRSRSVAFREKLSRLQAMLDQLSS